MPSTANSTSPSSEKSKSSDAGVIAGSVVGGVAGIAIICFVVYVSVRRRRKQKTVPYTEKAAEEMPTSASYNELHGKPWRAGRAEHAGSQLHEMEERHQELP